MEQEQEEKLETTQAPVAPEESKPNFFQRFWFVFVILAVVLILLVGILWITNQRLMVPKAPPTPTPTPVVEIDTTTAALEQQGTSDEITAIEADLETTDLSDIDKELTDIEAELTSP